MDFNPDSLDDPQENLFADPAPASEAFSDQPATPGAQNGSTRAERGELIDTVVSAPWDGFEWDRSPAGAEAQMTDDAHRPHRSHREEFEDLPFGGSWNEEAESVLGTSWLEDEPPRQSARVKLGPRLHFAPRQSVRAKLGPRLRSARESVRRRRVIVLVGVVLLGAVALVALGSMGASGRHPVRRPSHTIRHRASSGRSARRAATPIHAAGGRHRSMTWTRTPPRQRPISAHVSSGQAKRPVAQFLHRQEPRTQARAAAPIAGGLRPTPAQPAVTVSSRPEMVSQIPPPNVPPERSEFGFER